MKRKKILFVVESMGGGVFTYTVDLANELVKKYDLYIAYALRRQTPADFRQYFDPRIHLMPVHEFRREISPLHDVRAVFELKKIAREIKPDVIHLHSSKAGAVGRTAFSNQKTPLFYTPHGYSFLMKNHSAVKRVIYRGIEKAGGLVKCTTISCSYGEHQESLKLTRQAAYVDNGINTEVLDRIIHTQQQKAEQVKKGFTVFTIGRICYQKNPKLFRQIAEALPEVHFLWIGDGELREELDTPNIEVTGWIPREKVIRLALAADVFVLPSLWEGLPVSLLEAMYMKKLCVVSDVIGSRDVIRNGENGYICDSLEDYARVIRKVREEYPLGIAEQGHRDICSHYNVAEMARQYERIYFSGNS